VGVRLGCGIGASTWQNGSCGLTRFLTSSVGWKSSDGMEFRFPWCDLSLVLAV
jgi:hypothetical protein